MPRAKANGIEIEYETFGDPDDPPVLLISGLGSQLVAWDVDFCNGLVDRGFYVIRFDNRDVGLSTKTDFSGDIDLQATILGAVQGEQVSAPYTISTMAADATGLLDTIGIEHAHVAGASLGGMIAQAMAIEHRERVLSLTSIMSTTGDPDVGQPNAELAPLLLRAPATDRESFIAQAVETSRMIGSPENLEEDRVRARAGVSFDRCFYPKGAALQMLAAIASESRSAALRKLDINALVVHGDVDPLINVSGGERTAECIQGAELVILEGMGHDLPTFFWARIIEGITNLASRSAATA